MLELKFADTKKSAEEWGVCAVNIDRKNCSADTARISFITDISTEFDNGGALEIFLDGTRKFVGELVQAPRSLTGKSRGLELIAKNPWADLDAIIYQQLWSSASSESNETVLTPVFRSKVILGQNGDGDKIKVSAQVVDILQYAIEHGANISIGNIDADGEMLLDESTDISCAEAIRKTLRWLPNTQVWFDYSDTSKAPVINIAQRENLEEVSLSESGTGVRKIVATSRPDLKVEGVIIKYESRNVSDGFAWCSVKEDIYPEQTKAGKRVIVMSVALAGLKESVHITRLVCSEIIPSSKAWWKERLKWLEDYAEDDFEILSYNRKFPTLTKELEEGYIAPHINATAKAETITAKVKLTHKNGTVLVQRISVSLVATNASSGVYSNWSVSQKPEEMPNGVAKRIFDAASGLQYEGYLEILSTPAETFVGKKNRNPIQQWQGDKRTNF